MRALRILLITAVILGGLLAIGDRVAVHFAEGVVADQIKSHENLSTTPDVSINGFPYLTQLAAGELDDVEIGIKSYEAATDEGGGAGGGGAGGGEKIRIDDLNARMKGVRFSGNFSSVTATEATGTARVTYDELLKTAKSEATQVAPGVTARVVGLSDGGNGKIKVAVEATVLGAKLPRPVYVLSSLEVRDGEVKVHADALPRFGGIQLPESRIRGITDFRQKIEGLPYGIRLDKVEAAEDGVEITVKGSDIKLAG
ncbi:DUF2993 domain-containing protein [Streptomyces sp. RY43-2]|uniref:DUF2993 domain-containing protein n=1 Tax=Streptomyces macrolidinus TaxID=2952607 RepID=A0ABT0ZKP9_9ACTN|nr:DUF2993 domain-containing protein [Streptomyces macrolidinus]MCN9244174.1 DUF2993 domain-containing protein [Streptomyces macrolidinus]